MTPTGFFKRGSVYRASAITLAVLMAPAPGVPLVAAVRAPARTQSPAPQGANAVQQNATDVAVTMFGKGAREWPTYKNPDGSIVVRSPNNGPVVRANPDGGNDVWQRDHSGSWEHGKLVSGVYMVFSDSNQYGGNLPPKKPSDAVDLQPLPAANLIYVGGEKGPANPPQKSPQSSQAAQAAVSAQIEAAQQGVMVKVNALKGDWTINGVQLAPATAAGLVTIRDIYSKQLKYFETYAGNTLASSDADKTALINKLKPAVDSARLWIDLRKHFREDNLAGWHDYFAEQSAKARAAGDTKTAELIDQAVNIASRSGRNAAEEFILTQTNQALESHALVAALVSQTSGPITIAAFNTAVQSAMDKATLERARVEDITTVDGMTEFFGPQYQRIWGPASMAYGRYSQAWFKHFGDNASAFISLKGIIDRQWDDVLAAGVIGLAIISIVIPPIAIALGAKAFAGVVVVGAAGTSLLASGTQIVWDGERAFAIINERDNARAGQSALGAQAVRQLEDKANDAVKQVIVDGGVVILDAVGLAMAGREYQALKNAQAIDEAAKAAKVAPTVHAERIIASLPENQAAIYKQAGLLPQKTIEIDGRIMHLSQPFAGPGGRTGILVFQEVDGKITVRSWYLSNEHGIWKAAPAVTDGGLNKGPQTFIVTDGKKALPFDQVNTAPNKGYIYINEATVDLDGRLQEVLFNQVAERGVLQGDEALHKQALMGFLPPGDRLNGTAFEHAITAQSGMPVQNAINRPFVLHPGWQPRPVPISTWTADLTLYGKGQGYVFLSQDGKYSYTVIRAVDRNGVVRTWVPSIQEVGSPMTAWGTRPTAINSPLTNTPIRHWSDFFNPPPGVKGVTIGDFGKEYGDFTRLNNNWLHDYFDWSLGKPTSAQGSGVSGLTTRPFGQLPPGMPPEVVLNSPVALGAGAVISGGRGTSTGVQVPPSTVSGHTTGGTATPGATVGRGGASAPSTSAPAGAGGDYGGLDGFGKMLLERMGAADGPSPTPDLDDAVREVPKIGNGSTGMYLPRFGDPGASGNVFGAAFSVADRLTAVNLAGSLNWADVEAVLNNEPLDLSLTPNTPVAPAPTPNAALAIALKYINRSLAAGLRETEINGVGPNTFAPLYGSSPASNTTPFVPLHNTDGGWSSCQSCHPSGTSDNITWSFGSSWTNLTPNVFLGKPSTDATGQRILNWTAIFDEAQDFERNTTPSKEQGEAVDGGTFLWPGLGGGEPAPLTGRALSMADGLRQWVAQWFEPRLHAWRGVTSSTIGGGAVTIRQRGGGAAATAAAAGKVAISFVATGNATGDAFKMRVVNPTGEPLAITVPDGLALEPVNATAPPAPAGAREFAVSGYCADFAKPSPRAGGVYRIAANAAQSRLGDAKYLMRAARRLLHRKQLHPDSDEALYALAIRQYALWTRIESWDEKKFGENFIERTKKNVTESKQAWTREMEAAVKGVIPNRWQDIQRVLRDAEALKSEATRK